MSSSIPPPLLRAIVRRLEDAPAFAGLCAGFEDGRWRHAQLAEHLLEWLPEFALNEREYGSVSGANARRQLRRAAEAIYASAKYESRGEVGEILLHAILRQEFGSEPVISKIFFKDTPNDTVKGFDAVHVVEAPDGLELWLGEVKLYQDVASAVRDVVAELETHTRIPYLRTEFAAICRKFAPDHRHQDALLKLLDPNTSMDEVFERVCVPVLLTYDSRTVASHTRTDAAYRAALEAEFARHYERFADAALPKEIRLILLLLPMNTKALLLERFDRKLKGLLE